MADYEAIVVGAGPAGSAAAIALARAGRRVLLLDRAEFPRDKPCGDLIGARALALARRLGVDEADLTPYPPLAGAYLAAGSGTLDLAPSPRSPIRPGDSRVIPRIVFDDALVRTAALSGAELRRVTVREVSPFDPETGTRAVRGTGPDGPVELRAPLVIIAGGYGCRVADGIAPAASADDPARGIAMRGYLTGVSGPPGRIVFCLDDWLLPGYGWIFPLPGGRANIGVGTLAGDGGHEHLRDLYRRFVTDPASPAAAWLASAKPDSKARTWPLDLGPRRRRLTADGLLVAGEAAGLVGPLTGAGIGFALASGMRAGETAAAALESGDWRSPALRPYVVYVRRRIRPQLRAEWLAQRYL